MKNSRALLVLAVSVVLIAALTDTMNPQAQRQRVEPRSNVPVNSMQRNSSQPDARRPNDSVIAAPERPAPTDTTSDEVSQPFQKPRWKDQRLDWCLNWGADCGQPAADHFCKRRRYTGARDFRAEPNVGRSEPTRLAGSDQVCNEPFCTGFEYITCYGPVPANRIFAPPKWQETALDWCVSWGRDCGKPAADSFCRAQGFSESLYFQADSGVGAKPTRLIGSDQICNGRNCVAFQIITCKP
jgi:hypothetical protein